MVIRVGLANDLNSKMKGVRLAFSSFEVRLMDERERKNAEMAPFNSNFGDPDGTRYEVRVPLFEFFVKQKMVSLVI